MELVIPSFLALEVIMLANPVSVPSGDKASATTTQASFPDKTIMPRIKSLTVTLSVVSRNIEDPR